MKNNDRNWNPFSKEFLRYNCWILSVFLNGDNIRFTVTLVSWWCLKPCRTAVSIRCPAATGTTVCQSCVGNIIAPKQFYFVRVVFTARVWLDFSSLRTLLQQVRLCSKIYILHQAAFGMVYNQTGLYIFALRLPKTACYSLTIKCMLQTTLDSDSLIRHALILSGWLHATFGNIRTQGFCL